MYLTSGSLAVYLRDTHDRISIEVSVNEGSVQKPSWKEIGQLRYRYYQFQERIKEDDRVLVYCSTIQQAPVKTLRQMKDGINLMIAITDDPEAFLANPQDWLEDESETPLTNPQDWLEK